MKRTIQTIFTLFAMTALLSCSHGGRLTSGFDEGGALSGGKDGGVAAIFDTAGGVPAAAPTSSAATLEQSFCAPAEEKTKVLEQAVFQCPVAATLFAQRADVNALAVVRLDKVAANPIAKMITGDTLKESMDAVGKAFNVEVDAIKSVSLVCNVTGLSDADTRSEAEQSSGMHLSGCLDFAVVVEFKDGIKIPSVLSNGVESNATESLIEVGQRELRGDKLYAFDRGVVRIIGTENYVKHAKNSSLEDGCLFKAQLGRIPQDVMVKAVSLTGFGETTKGMDEYFKTQYPESKVYSTVAFDISSKFVGYAWVDVGEKSAIEVFARFELETIQSKIDEMLAGTTKEMTNVTGSDVLPEVKEETPVETIPEDVGGDTLGGDTEIPASDVAGADVESEVVIPSIDTLGSEPRPAGSLVENEPTVSPVEVVTPSFVVEDTNSKTYELPSSTPTTVIENSKELFIIPETTIKIAEPIVTVPETSRTAVVSEPTTRAAAESTTSGSTMVTTSPTHAVAAETVSEPSSPAITTPIQTSVPATLQESVVTPSVPAPDVLKATVSAPVLSEPTTSSTSSGAQVQQTAPQVSGQTSSTSETGVTRATATTESAPAASSSPTHADAIPAASVPSVPVVPETSTTATTRSSVATTPSTTVAAPAATTATTPTTRAGTTTTPTVGR